ncbi:uncharacterized protein [Anabrus simplex]|uniref:uncharacterized protein n=1 Tax=Anabrus simplex TaxID=316456 RepID=UPI0035A2F5D5
MDRVPFILGFLKVYFVAVMRRNLVFIGLKQTRVSTAQDPSCTAAAMGLAATSPMEINLIFRYQSFSKIVSVLHCQPSTQPMLSICKVTPAITPSRHSQRKNAVPMRKENKSLKSSHNRLLQAKLDLVSLQAKIFKQQNRRHLAEHRMRMKLLRLKYMAAKKRQM